MSIRIGIDLGGTKIEAIALAPDHISTYGLTVEEGTPYAAWRAREPGEAPADVRSDVTL